MKREAPNKDGLLVKKKSLRVYRNLTKFVERFTLLGLLFQPFLGKKFWPLDVFNGQKPLDSNG